MVAMLHIVHQSRSGLVMLPLQPTQSSLINFSSKKINIVMEKPCCIDIFREERRFSKLHTKTSVNWEMGNEHSHDKYSFSDINLQPSDVLQNEGVLFPNEEIKFLLSKLHTKKDKDLGIITHPAIKSSESTMAVVKMWLQSEWEKQQDGNKISSTPNIEVAPEASTY